MKSKLIHLSVITGTLFLGTVASAQTSTTPERPVAPEVRPERPPLPDALKDLISDFREQRRDILEARKALVEALRNASEEERRAIIQAFRDANLERVRNERDLRREIHRELQDIRRERRAAASEG